MLVPSIDLMNGKAVQLIGGEKKVLESDRDPIELAREFNRYGEVAVIDLDAALGKGDNTELIKSMCRVAECRVGGGIRTKERADTFIKTGAKKIIIGTMATREFLSMLPKDKIIVALDTKKGKVVDSGWRRSTQESPLKRARKLENYCSGFLCTIVDNEGRLEGTDIETIRNIRKVTKKKITAAGGITTIDEIRKLEDMGIYSQIGMAIYTGKIDPADVFVSLIDFRKNNDIVPTIVQSVDNNQVLMLPFSSPESVRKALKTGQGWYYSRSRRGLWRKGEESGNTQELISVRYDCDRDALLFMVKQSGPACHKGQYSCFGDKNPDILQEEFEIIKDRIENPIEGSFTSVIAQSDDNINFKLNEEMQEVIECKNNEERVWEIADVLYFIAVLMAKNGIEWQDVWGEMAKRRK